MDSGIAALSVNVATISLKTNNMISLQTYTIMFNINLQLNEAFQTL